MTFSIYGKIKHVPNHQPDTCFNGKSMDYPGKRPQTVDEDHDNEDDNDDEEDNGKNIQSVFETCF